MIKDTSARVKHWCVILWYFKAHAPLVLLLHTDSLWHTTFTWVRSDTNHRHKKNQTALHKHVTRDSSLKNLNTVIIYSPSTCLFTSWNIKGDVGLYTTSALNSKSSDNVVWGKQRNLNRHLLKMNKSAIKHNAQGFKQIVMTNQDAASLNKCKWDLNAMMEGTFSDAVPQYFSPFFSHND